ncbi:MAG: NAD kinase [Bacteroidota bacterium]
MHVALFGRKFDPGFFPVIEKMVRLLEADTEVFFIKESFYEFLKEGINFKKPVKLYTDHKGLPTTCFCMISIGGDGTLLDTLPYLRNSGIPVLGINAGRLGFLSSVSTDDIGESIKALKEHNYRLDERSLLMLETPEGELFGSFPYALNELTILKRDNTTMISISAYVNGHYLNTYWADGLMVATPTGSTGYSLSCGGPIISPDSENFIITPIASHNLTVRPIVIKDNSLIKLRVEGRVKSHLIVMDSRSVPLEHPVDLFIKKAHFKVKLISIENNNFFKTIRNKLAWGYDKRN